MHINLETDYAVRIVDLLAKRKNRDAGGGRLDAASIAAETNVPGRFALKILRKLAAGGMVKSYKGIYGGYELVKTPSEISLYDVVELAEGEYNFSRCLDGGYDCSNESGPPCAYRRIFGEITEEVRGLLKKQTFDKLIL